MNDAYKQALSVLTTFLESPERKSVCFDVDELQGAIVAVLSSPDDVTETELGFLILGDDTSGEEVWFEDGEIRRAWVTCLNTLDEALALETFSLYDLYDLNGTLDGPPQPFSQWCEGYLHGYLLTENSWQEAHQFLASQELAMEEDHLSLLNVFASMAQWDDALRENDDPERLKEGVPLLIQAANDAIIKYHKLALLLEDNRMQTADDVQPYVRDVEKTGRNEPCPCGSGKKYKKCCLH